MIWSIRRCKSLRFGKFVALLSLGILAFSALGNEPIPLRPDPPGNYLIPDVPFIAWRDAARWVYPDSNIVNPSITATYAMSATYWFPNIEAKAFFGTESSRNKERIQLHRDEASSISDLKGYLANGIPVTVYPALTPWAHPANWPVVAMMAYFKGCKIKKSGPYSGVLGRMLGFEQYSELEQCMKSGQRLVQESVLMSSRLVVGYDDRRQTVFLHDPSFGPAWEVSYTDFDRMWAQSKRAFQVVYPKGGAAPRQPPAGGARVYRDRTADERAAEHYVMGYALSSLGRSQEAQKRFRDGLALSGISDGYRHLLSFELALNLGFDCCVDEAIALTEEATVLVPERRLPWLYLAGLYRHTQRGDRLRMAAAAEAKAQRLESDPDALRAVAVKIPGDFFVIPLAKVRGWTNPE